MRAAPRPSTCRVRRARAPAGTLVLGALAALAACAPAPPGRRPVAQEVAPVPPATRTATAGERYRVVPASSEVRVLAFRDGPLAQLGHNHVLVARELAGELSVPGAAQDLRFELSLPVAALSVDEPAARREEGDAFASEPSAADLAGTRRNLLGPAVLDADHYPLLRVAGLGAARESGSGPPGGRYRVRLRIELRGQATALEVPVIVTTTADALAAAGEFRVAQSSLGLAPFSVALGALRVADELVVRFRIVARRAT